MSTVDRSDPVTGWDCFPAKDAFTSVSDLRAVVKVGRRLLELVP